MIVFLSFLHINIVINHKIYFKATSCALKFRFRDLKLCFSSPRDFMVSDHENYGTLLETEEEPIEHKS